MSDDKKTLNMTKPGPANLGPERHDTEEIVTGPILLKELGYLRKEGNERGVAVQLLGDYVKTLDGAVKGALIQIQQYYELFGGKFRALEGRADGADLRAAAHEAQLVELKRQLEARIAEIEKELAMLRDTKLGVSVMPGMEAKISLSEEEMAKKLEEEAVAHKASLAKETAAREELDKRLDARMAPQELKMDVLLKALNVKLPPPPGSIPPVSDDGDKPKKPEKNAIEKQARLIKVALAIVSMVGTGGVLDKIGVLDALHRYFTTLWNH